MSAQRADQHRSARGRRWRIRPDLHLGSLAKRLGCSPGHLSDILHGKKALTPEMSLKLGAALGVQPDRLPAHIQSWLAQEALMRRNGR